MHRSPAYKTPARVAALVMLSALVTVSLFGPEQPRVAAAQGTDPPDVCGPIAGAIVAHAGQVFAPSVWSKIASISVDIPFQKARGRYESLVDPLPSATLTHIWLDPKVSFECQGGPGQITLYFQYETSGVVLRLPTTTCLDPDPSACPGGSSGGGTPGNPGGTGGGGDPGTFYLCTWENTYVNGVLVQSVLISCIEV